MSTRAHLPLLLLFAAATICRLVVAAGHEVITNDSASYLRLAESLAEGRGYVGIQGDLELKFPPGYSALIAAVIWLGVPALLAGSLVTAFAGALLVVPSFSLGRRLGGDATGWAAALFAAFAPPLVYAGSLTIAEVLLTLLVVGALALAAAPGVRRALGAGMLAGAGFLVKPEAFAFLLAALAGVALVDRARRMPAAGALLAGFVVVAGPWIVFLNTQVDAFLLDGKSGMYGHVCRRLGSGMTYEAAAAGVANGSTGPLLRFNESVGKFVYSDELLSAPGAFVACWARNVERVIDVAARESYVHPLLILAAGAGFVRALVAGGAVASVAALLVLAGTLAVMQIVGGLVTMWIAPRYLLAPLALVMILAAHGVTMLRPFALPAHASRRRAAVAWVVLALALAPWVPDLPGAFGERLPRVERDVHTAIVSDANGRRPRIMSQFAVPSFYADADWVQTPVGEPEDVLRYARRQGVTHVVGSTTKSRALQPILADPDAFGLRVVPLRNVEPTVVVLAVESSESARY